MRRVYINKFGILTILAILLGLIFLLSNDVVISAPVAADKISNLGGELINPEVTNTSVAMPNCRFGVAAFPGQDQWIDYFSAGWYLDFRADDLLVPTNGSEYVHMVEVLQDRDAQGNFLPTYRVSPKLNDTALGALIDANPGAVWIIGNETDRGPDPGQIQGGQGATYPDKFAEGIHEVHYYIKERDPDARTAFGGLVEVTPGRLQYLELVWDAYVSKFGSPIPVDIWTMHLYVLPEARVDGTPNNIANVALGTDPTLAIRESGGDQNLCSSKDVYCVAEHDDMVAFSEQVVEMRTWMRDHGQRQKPLLLTEYSLLYPPHLVDEYGDNFNSQRVTDFLNSSITYLESATDLNLGYSADGDHLVQQWLWFSVHAPNAGLISNLLEDDLQTPTQQGRAFKSAVQSRGTYVNLLPAAVSNPVSFGPSAGAPADVILSVEVRNNGNIGADSQFQVTFYKDAALTQPIGTEIVPGPGGDFPGMTGCATRGVTVSTTWQNVPTGYHKYYVKVDSAGSITESKENDNVGSGYVWVNPTQAFGPLVTGG